MAETKPFGSPSKPTYTGPSGTHKVTINRQKQKMTVDLPNINSKPFVKMDNIPGMTKEEAKEYGAGFGPSKRR